MGSQMCAGTDWSAQLQAAVADTGTHMAVQRER